MILVEHSNDGALVKHYSDKNVFILQAETGAKYREAIDVAPCRYTYVETTELADSIALEPCVQ